MQMGPRWGTLALGAGWLASAVVVFGCSSSDAMYDVQMPPNGPPGDPPAVTTFHKDVEPIVQKSCQGCHATGGLAPFSLTSYASARAWATLMAQATSERRMPPWGAQDTSECRPPLPWRKDARLSDKDIATIAAWAEAGAPEGDPKDAPPPREPPPRDLPGMTLELAPKQPFTTGGKADQFRCFVL